MPNDRDMERAESAYEQAARWKALIGKSAPDRPGIAVRVTGLWESLDRRPADLRYQDALREGMGHEQQSWDKSKAARELAYTRLHQDLTSGVHSGMTMPPPTAGHAIARLYGEPDYGERNEDESLSAMTKRIADEMNRERSARTQQRQAPGAYVNELEKGPSKWSAILDQIYGQTGDR